MATFNSLHYEIQVEIFQYLTFEELISSAQFVNKQWHGIIQDPHFWKNVSFKPPLGMTTDRVISLLHNSPFLRSFEFREGLKGEKIFEALCKYNKHITSITFVAYHVDEKYIKMLLENIPDLEYLQISHVIFSTNVKLLGKFHKLKTLKCIQTTHFETHYRSSRDKTYFEDTDWPSLENLQISSESGENIFEILFLHVAGKLLSLEIHYLQNSRILENIKNCVRLEQLSFNFLSRQIPQDALENFLTALRNLENLKKLRLTSFVHADANVLCKAFHNITFPKLIELDLTHSMNFSSQAARSVGLACPNLEIICLHGCVVLDDFCLKELAQCRHLRVLDIAGCCGITETGLSYLKNVPLTELNISWIGLVSSPMLQCIAEMQSLNILRMDHTEVDFEHLKNTVRRLENLKLLSLFSCNGVDGALLKSFLSKCLVLHGKQTLSVLLKEKVSALRCLQLNGIPNNLLESLPFSTNIEEINLNFLMRRCSRFREHIPVLKQFNELKVLSLTGLVATDDTLLCQLLDGNELLQLRELSLPHCLAVGEEVAHSISGNYPGLEKLMLKGCVSLNDNGLHAISTMKNLQVLDISGCRSLSERGLFSLCNLVNLKELMLCGLLSVTVELFQALLSLPVLNIIVVDYTNATNYCAEENKWHCTGKSCGGKVATYRHNDSG